MKLSDRVSRLTASPTLQVKMEADRLRREGVDVLDFGPGEPDFDTPEPIREAAKRALDAGDTHYGSANGKPELRAAVARAVRERHGGDWVDSEVLIGVGGKGVLYLLMQALLDPGDEVLVFSPYWVSFPDQVRLAGATPVIVETEEQEGFIPDPARAAAQITPRTRCMILNSPSNPTGAVIPAEVLEQFADLAREHDLCVVSDETYDRFVYPGHHFASMAGLRERSGGRIVLVNSFSKTYAMTGWRVGFALGSREVIASMARLQSHDATHPTSFAQAAALAALEGDDGSVERMLEEYGRRRRTILEGLESIPGVECRPPGGAFYVFPSVKGLCQSVGCASSRELAEVLLKRSQVAVVPGEAFGAEGFLRFSYALSTERIEAGLERLRSFAGGA